MPLLMCRGLNLVAPPPYLFSDIFCTHMLQIHHCANLRPFLSKIILALALFVYFQSIGHLGRCCHRVAMCVRLFVCLSVCVMSPFHIIFFEASHFQNPKNFRYLSNKNLHVSGIFKKKFNENRSNFLKSYA